MSDHLLSITGYIDLFGFSNHLELANNDPRTEIGKSAIKRIEILDESLKLLFKEKEAYPLIYPDNISVRRINDAIIITHDLLPELLPEQQSRSRRELSPHQINTLLEKDPNIDKIDKHAVFELLSNISLSIGYFLGVVSRLHHYINKVEIKHNFPGCRTIISSGIRKKITNYKGEDDPLSLNLSFSNAYIASDLGSEFGFNGNYIFLDENVARNLYSNEFVRKIVYISQFTQNLEYFDPFSRLSPLFIQNHFYKKTKKIEVEILRQKYSFRRVNDQILTLLQLVPKFIDIVERKNTDEDKFEESLSDFFTNELPEFESIISNEDKMKVPLFFLLFDLESNIDSFFET